MMLTYREVTGLWSARVPDGPDSDQYPDTVLLEGHVTFEPEYRVPLVYPGEHIVIEPMHAVIHEGVLYGETVVGDDVVRGPLFLPVTVDDAANQSWSWVAKFQGMRLGEYGEEVSLPSVRFQVPAGDDALDLSEVIPVSQSGNTITLRGPGLSEEDARALVDAGLDARGLLPDGSLPSVARAEVEQIVADTASVAGVPIFETLAEAQAWEAANPGRVALTLEGEGGGDPGTGPDPGEPGVLVASDDFSHADGYITGKPTPVGNRMWVQDSEGVATADGQPGALNKQPNVRGGRYVNGCGYVDTGLTSLAVSFDYRAHETGDVRTRLVHVGVGGYLFILNAEVNLYRMFNPRAQGGSLVTSVSAGAAFVNEGHCRIEYDGITAIMKVNGDTVLEHVGDGRTSTLVGVDVRGLVGIGSGDTVGTEGTLTGSWIDNLKVESL